MSLVIEWDADKKLGRKELGQVEKILASGELIVYATNTLYGLGASIYSEKGLQRLVRVKARPAGMPISVMASKEDIRKLCDVPASANKFLSRNSISITAILPASSLAPKNLVHDGTLAVRLPCSALCESLVNAGPITSTSANVHGKKPPVTLAQARAQLGDSVALYIDSGQMNGGQTTLVDFTGKKPNIIREGVVSAEEVRKVYGR